MRHTVNMPLYDVGYRTLQGGVFLYHHRHPLRVDENDGAPISMTRAVVGVIAVTLGVLRQKERMHRLLGSRLRSCKSNEAWCLVSCILAHHCGDMEQITVTKRPAAYWPRCRGPESHSCKVGLGRWPCRMPMIMFRHSPHRVMRTSPVCNDDSAAAQPFLIINPLFRNTRPPNWVR